MFPIHVTIMKKHLRTIRGLSGFLVLGFLAGSGRADDWPQWQGPDRNAMSKETGLRLEWPKDGPPLAWKIKGLGGGYSAPSVAAGRIFGLSNRGEEEVVWVRSESDGKELWVTPLGPAGLQGPPQGKEGSGSTPTVDGDRVYVLGLRGDLACLGVKDGAIQWRVSLPKDLGGNSPAWRYNESPLVDGDKVICTPGGTEATVMALEKMTGKVIWKCQVPTGTDASAAAPGRGPGGGGENAGGSDGPGGRGGPGGPPGRGRFGSGSGAAYASAIAIDFEGQRQYVQFTSKALVGIAAADGKLLWRYPRPANPMGINCSTPVHLAGQIFAASAYGAGGGLVKLSKTPEGGVNAEEVFFTRKMQNHHGGMIVLDGALYGANGGNEGGALVCLDVKTGNVLWDARDLEGRPAPKGSVAFAAGRLYYRTETGTMLLIEPSVKGYVERGRFEQPDRSSQPAWPHPVIANGHLYLRDQDVLLCYDVKSGGQ